MSQLPLSQLPSPPPALPHFTAFADLAAHHQARLQSAAPAATILGLIRPPDPTDLAAAIAAIRGAGHGILPCGGCTKIDWGGAVGQGQTIVALSTQFLNQIVEHAVDDMTITVEAGLPIAQLQAHLAQQQQFLSLDPRYVSAGATVGGVIATADSGSLRHRYGGVRDILLGVQFVRSDGELVKAGGRVVKNVAGYDLMKLMTGSYGTLGVITQATFRTYPCQSHRQTLILTGEPDALATTIAALQRSLLTPLSVDWLSASAITSSSIPAPMGVIVRFESVAASVSDQCDRLTALAAQFQVQVTPAPDPTALWQAIDTIGEKTIGESSSDQPIIIGQLGIPSHRAAALLPTIAELIPTAIAIIHAGSGLGRFVVNTNVPPERITELRQHCEAAGGFLSILVAPAAMKATIDPWGIRGNGVSLMQAVKREFDPTQRLNPGRMV
ncbi:MAG: hypothetical protein RLZZ511_1301 [Cyanobacteriota bacterium]|jgi:glycolate oxidase FAD binding subunit